MAKYTQAVPRIHFTLNKTPKGYLEKGEEILQSMLENKNYRRLLTEWQRYYKKVSDPAHDWKHIEFVLKLALYTAKIENADLDAVFISSLLHDIAREAEIQGKCKDHEVTSAKQAKAIIKNLNLTPGQKQNIVHSIKEHSSSTGKPESKEAEILADCDRLYAIITNPQRCILYNKTRGRKMEQAFNYLKNKLERIKPKKFTTETVRSIAKYEYPLLKRRMKGFGKLWEKF